MRWSTNGDVIERLTVSVIFAVLIAYVASRAALMSITHDEALTYVWHVKGSVTDIVSFSTLGLADNNHMLFTLLAKASTIAFGPSELALRLPSVIAYAGFLAALYLTLRLFVQGVVLWLFFLFVAINPYVIDMFSIARGYGLGMALGTAGLYLFLSAIEDKESCCSCSSRSSAFACSPPQGRLCGGCSGDAASPSRRSAWRASPGFL